MHGMNGAVMNEDETGPASEYAAADPELSAGWRKKRIQLG